jgi:hypothetical protein
MRHTKTTFQERVAKETKGIVKKVFKVNEEIANCKRSILMHNAGNWIAGDQISLGCSLVESTGCVAV